MGDTILTWNVIFKLNLINNQMIQTRQRLVRQKSATYLDLC